MEDFFYIYINEYTWIFYCILFLFQSLNQKYQKKNRKEKKNNNNSKIIIKNQW